MMTIEYDYQTVNKILSILSNRQKVGNQAQNSSRKLTVCTVLTVFYREVKRRIKNNYDVVV